ncbi:MAG: outer membrane beta-barrel protein [Bacteroidota bacterium]
MKLNLSYLLLCLLLIGATTLSAQRRFKAGPVVGLNASQIDGDRYAGYNKMGLNAGIRVAAQLTDRSELVIELLYSQRGSQSELVRGTDLFPFQIKTDYVAVPIMYNLKDWLIEEDGGDSYHKVSITGGLTYGRLITSEIDDGTPSSPLQDLAGFFNKTDISFNLGASFFINSKIGFDFRWTRSLVLLYDQNKSGLNANSMRAKFLSFRAMYML